MTCEFCQASDGVAVARVSVNGVDLLAVNLCPACVGTVSAFVNARYRGRSGSL